MGESDGREISAVDKMRFGVHLTPFLSASLNRISSPKKTFIRKKKKMDPAERLRRYVELKYGKLNVKKKKRVEKKS